MVAVSSSLQFLMRYTQDATLKLGDLVRIRYEDESFVRECLASGLSFGGDDPYNHVGAVAGRVWLKQENGDFNGFFIDMSDIPEASVDNLYGSP